jgi:hypothetical protein
MTATNRPFCNFMGAGVCARGAQMDWEDPMFTKWCLDVAEEDFAFAKAHMHITGQGQPETPLYAQAAIAANLLYAVTKKETYLQDAVHFAKILMACQEQERKPAHGDLHGFFYEDRTHKRILAYFHRSYEHTPVQALADLLKATPNHADAALWRTALARYADYIKETLVSPYALMTSAIYEVNNTDYSKIYHEGNRSVGQPSMEEYNAQVQNGKKLSETHYLRTFPVAYQFRGFHATLLSKARAAAMLSKTFGDKGLRAIAIRQMEWILGMNPYAASTIFGEGYDFVNLYGAFLGDVVGAVPVGIETFENLDLPYLPMQSNATYKEVWVHSAARVMWLIADLRK